jgi:hypothetical protein
LKRVAAAFAAKNKIDEMAAATFKGFKILKFGSLCLYNKPTRFNFTFRK